MFIKVTTSGGRRYAQLVESFRNESGQPRQRTLATLGRLESGGEVDRLIGALLRAQGREASSSSVAVSDLRFLDARPAGDLFALWQLWRALGLDGLALAWSSSRSDLDVLAWLRAMVFNRLCDPGSKLGVLRWLHAVALPVGFGLGADEAGGVCGQGPVLAHQHLLRAMDVLDEHADALGQRLAVLMRPLIDQELSVVFYDLTTVRVHGVGKVADDVRLKGHSKDGGVARQFVLSLVQTADGLPIAHQVHPGNTAEAGTLLPMIRALLARWPLKRVVLVADRGLLNLGNLRDLEGLQTELKALGSDVVLQYVLAVPAARYGDFDVGLRQLDAVHEEGAAWVDEMRWTSRGVGDNMGEDSGLDGSGPHLSEGGPSQPVQSNAATQPQRRRTKPRQAAAGQDDKVTAHNGTFDYRVVVDHDPEAAQQKTAARRSQIDELIALGQQWSNRLDEQDGGQRRRGRPLSDSGAKARLYHAVREAGLGHVLKVDLQSELFQYTLDEDKLAHLSRLDGKLLLVTNTDEPAAAVVARYKSLADIERGFRALKSDIEIGPVYHRLPKRIRAHALVCFLALLLHRVLRMRLKAAGRAESPMRLLEQLRRIQHQTVQTAQGQRVHGLTELGGQQRELFSAIELAVPTPTSIGAPALQASETEVPKAEAPAL
jgi:hypothetical protein